MKDNKILKVTDDVSWIGVLDPDLRVFDIVMETKSGTTYNSYFINADKKTIVDATKVNFWDTYLEKIEAVINPKDIAYIIVNHTEPDHSGNIGNLLKIAPNAKVVGSGNAIRYLNDMLGFEFPCIIVKDGHTLDLGNKTIRFIGAANLHWPDTMFSYLVEDKVLFTCDCFGCHYCNENIFDDLAGEFDEAFRFYFNVIMKPFSRFMLKAIERIHPLDIAVIAPGHGPVLRSKWKKYVDLSEELAKATFTYCERLRVFIPYVSAYRMTAHIAEKIAEGIRRQGDFDVHVCDIENMPLKEIEDHIIRSSAILVGSPTLNKNTLIQIYQMMALINPLRDKGKLAAVFGSYGWSGEAIKIIRDNLANLRFTMFETDFNHKFTLNEKDEEKCFDFAKRFANKLLENNIAEE